MNTDVIMIIFCCSPVIVGSLVVGIIFLTRYLNRRVKVIDAKPIKEDTFIDNHQ